MANLTKCITEAVAAGRISAEKGQEWSKRIDDHEQMLNMSGEISPELARTRAEQAVFEAKRAEVALQRRQKALQTIAVHRMVQQAQRHPDGVGAGVMSLLVKDMGGRAGYSNVDNRAKAVLAQLQAKFSDVMDRYRTKAAGLVQDREGLRNMVKEIFGTSSGDANAKAAAQIWGEVAEMARQRFNKAGGAIPRREDWGMPQYHDPIRVQKVSKQEWIDEIIPMLDRQKMTDAAGNPLSDMDLRIMLDHSYDKIITNGLVDMMPGRIGGTKLANQRRDHRVLNFKDADAWLTYHDKYGHADIYTTLTDHITGMAHDIAKLEVLGPNPEASFRYMRDLAKKDGLEGTNMRMLESVWETVSGRANAAESVHFADFMQSVRNILVSAKLGSAFISSISDLGFLRQTAAFNGIPATKVLKRQLSLMNPANTADRRMAVKMQLTADAWVTRALAANRFTEVTGANFSAKMADFTMRASLLSAWTDAGRKAFGMEFQGMMAEQVGRSFDELPAALKSGFQRYGITPEEWDILRATDLLEHKGAQFFSPENLMKRQDLDEGARTGLATKIQEMILTETDYAVPTPDARVRTITTAGAKRGTVVGELARSGFMFKSFPITVITTHLYRGALQNGAKNKGAYLASIVASTTLLGAVALQMKELSRGKDPRSMDDPKFWASAFVQGGGAGIYGDFLFSDVNRFGGSLLKTTAGPMAQLALEDIPKVTLGNVQEFVRGEDTNLAADLVQFSRSYTPGGSLWYTRLAFEREVLDQLQLMADPKARSKFRRIQRRRRRDYGQNYWWRPGAVTPRRAPDFETATGG